MTQTCDRPGADHTGANDEISREGTGFSDQSTPAVPVGYKRCTRCGIMKAHSEFSRHRSKSDGLDLWCRACHAANRADKRANSPVARWMRGEVDDVPDGIEDWLIGQVDRGGENGCWTWQGPTSGGVYGFASFDGVMVRAHRVSLRLWTGAVVPDGMHVDHLCRNTLCCNVFHLEIVTPQVNNARSGSPSAVNARKTHCDNGNPLTGENLYVGPDGKRYCRACKLAHNRAHRARTSNGELTPLQKLNRGIFARTITFNVSERSA